MRPLTHRENTMQMVAVPLSKRKMSLLLAASVVFAIAGYWLFALDATEIASMRRYHAPWFVHAIGIASMVLGGWGIAMIARKWIDPKPGLVLDARGLTDNTSALSAGLIPWSDIAGFEVRRIQRQRILYVLLNDPKAYVAKFGPAKRALLNANLRFGPSPVAITSTALSIDFDALTALAERHLEAYRQSA